MVLLTYFYFFLNRYYLNSVSYTNTKIHFFIGVVVMANVPGKPGIGWGLAEIWKKRAEWLIENMPNKYGNFDLIELAFKIRGRCVSIGTSVFYDNSGVRPIEDPLPDFIDCSGVWKEEVRKYASVNAEKDPIILRQDGRFDIKNFHKLFQRVVFLNPIKNRSKQEYASGLDSNIFEDETFNLDFKMPIKGYFERGIIKTKNVPIKDILKPLNIELEKFYKELYPKGNESTSIELVKPHLSSSVWFRFIIGDNDRKKRRTYLSQIGHIYFGYVSSVKEIDPYKLTELHDRIKKTMVEKIVTNLES